MVESDQEQFYRIAFSYMKNEHDALDAVQESICKAYEHLSKLRESQYMKTWFTRILINTAINMLNQKKRLIADEFIEASVEADVHPMHQTEDKIDLMTSLEGLNDKEKAIVVLRFFEDYKLEDVSRTLDLPLNTTKTTLYRALKKMRVSLEEVNSDE